jgi:hypothetical protein
MPADIGCDTTSVNDLDALAAAVRTALQASRQDRCNALRHDLDAGDALIEAQARVSSNWKRWLRDNCFLKVRTAMLYQQLAGHRAEIEAEIERVGELSLRAAIRLVAGPSKRPPKPKRPAPDLLTAWRAASETERTDALAAIRVDEFYAVMPANWRAEMASRVAKPRSADEPFIKASEILRRALSLMKVTSTASPEVANAEREALAALRRLNVVLAGEGIDEVTIVRLYAKERRRAA